jgi:hypothetical protein
MFLVFFIASSFAVIYQFANGGCWNRKGRWHPKAQNPKLFWITTTLQTVLAIFFAGVHFLGPAF